MRKCVQAVSKEQTVTATSIKRHDYYGQVRIKNLDWGECYCYCYALMSSSINDVLVSDYENNSMLGLSKLKNGKLHPVNTKLIMSESF